MSTSTCTHCGYDTLHCECGKPRNSSGDVTRYTNYTNWKDKQNMYAMTSPRMYQRDSENNKFFEEILPINNEELKTWVERTTVHTIKLTEYSRDHHIYGTKRVWACHSSSRYCFICTLCDFVDILRSLALSILALYPKPVYWSVSESREYRLSATRT